jgi:hypothetical protein
MFNHNEVSLHTPIKVAKIKIVTTPAAGKDMKAKSHLTVGGNIK